MNTPIEPTPNDDTELKELAFLLWEQAGCPAGRDREFWLRAEAEIVERIKQKHGPSAVSVGSHAAN